MSKPTPFTDTTTEVLRVSAGSRSSSIGPPVTRATFSELGLSRILRNPKLRHNANFYPIHFRADGEHNWKNTQTVKDFWVLLQTQLAAFMRDPVTFETGLSNADWCLPLMLRAIGEILSTLGPPKDQSLVEDVPNIDDVRVANLEKLPLWLSRTLKSHCAPNRDKWVDATCEDLSKGISTQDAVMITEGFRNILCVLETMLLDIANYQIRCHLPQFIEETVEFEQNFLLKEIASRKIDVGASQAWFQAAKLSSKRVWAPPSSLTSDSRAFFIGLANLLLPSQKDTKLPEAFKFDEERIMQLRSDMLHAINLDLFHNSIPHTTLGSIAKHEDTMKEHVLSAQEDETLRQKSCLVIDLQLGNLKDPHFEDSQSRVFAKLIPDLIKLASYYMSLTLDELFKVATLPEPLPAKSPKPLPGYRRDLGDIAKRLAHIGVLHWRVWGPLVYLSDPCAETRGQQGGNSVDLTGDVSLRDIPQLTPTQGQIGQHLSLLRFYSSVKKRCRAVVGLQSIFQRLFCIRGLPRDECLLPYSDHEIDGDDHVYATSEKTSFDKYTTK